MRGIGTEENFTQQADVMSELFVHPLVVFPASLNKSLIPSWSEARNFELPKVGLCHMQVFELHRAWATWATDKSKYQAIGLHEFGVDRPYDVITALVWTS